MHTKKPQIVTKEQATFTELLDDREAIILDLENLHYYTLNATALFLWKQLRAGAATTVEQLSQALSGAFNINGDLAQSDTRAFLDELEGNGLIYYAQARGPVYGKLAAMGALPAYEAPQLQVSNSLTQVVLSGSSTIATAAISGG